MPCLSKFTKMSHTPVPPFTSRILLTPSIHNASLIIKDLLIPMRSINDRINSIEIYIPSTSTYIARSWGQQRTKRSPHIRTLQHLNAQITIDFTHDLNRVADREVRILFPRPHQYTFPSPYAPHTAPSILHPPATRGKGGVGE
jgi:hypothetical protein